ncbi:MAG: GGDEF domain-containing protein [Marinobacterium sp.]|nr:GGDEF domain-containing protein [Marinobacterium sp.]
MSDSNPQQTTGTRMLQKFHLSNLYTPSSNQHLAQLQDALRAAYPGIVDSFYVELLQDETARQFLDNQLVEERLKSELLRWLTLTLSPHTEDDVATVVALQRHVGEVHARINIPMSLVDSAMMMVKNGCFKALLIRLDKREAVYEAVMLINSILESSLSLINEAFLKGMIETERNAQSFRTNMTSHELVLEVERVRTSLFNWLSATTLDLMSGSPIRASSLTHSDFALWITHKLDLVCSQSSTSEQVKQLLTETAGKLENNVEDPKTLCLILNQNVNALAFQLSEIARTVTQMTERTDPLTQLIDRKYLPAIIQKETRQVMLGQNAYAIIMMDIDHFKQINDQYGHHAGDIVLGQVGTLVRKTVRVSDYCFRYGGEEFLILLPESTSEQAYQVAEEIRRALSNMLVALEDGQSLRLTSSFGVACFNGHPDYMETIKEADSALYTAKREGRNQTIVSRQAT